MNHHHIENLGEFFEEIYQENEISEPLWKNSNNLENVSRTKRVTVTPTLVIYHIEEPEQSNTILRRYKDQEKNFLRVTFEDDNGGNVRNLKYLTNRKFKDILKRFQILERTYKFLAYSSSQLKNNSAWMLYEQEGSCSVDTIHAEIGDLSDIKNPAKKATRLGQLFSTSLKGIILDHQITVQTISDIENTRYTFSDGVGKISANLIDQIKLNQKIKGIVSAIQIRCGGVKGILVSDPALPHNSIYFRKSMIKFESSSFDKNLEILDYSKFRPGYLNRQIILLLLSNGVNPEIFRQLQNENLQELEKQDHSILDYINNEHHLSPTRDLLNDCFDAKVSIANEPFVSAVVETIRVRSFINLKEKCNILVKDSARLTGVIDEFGILEYGQIYLCLSLSNGIKSKDCVIIKADKVLITKNPCIHPGDIRVLEAVDHDEARKHFQHLVNVVVFPSKGSRPHPDEIAGSDLDGDMYFVSWDQRLIPPETSRPMSYEAKTREEKGDVNTEDIIDFFIEFLNHDMLGKIDNLHLARADSSDNLAHNYKCLAYSDLHAIAVDYAKTGVPACFKEKKSQLVGISDRESRSWGRSSLKQWPDFMEKDPELTYESETILGILYRLIVSKIETSGIKYIFSRQKKSLSNSNIQIDCDMIEEGFEDHLELSFLFLEEYYKAIHELFNIYEIRTEYEIFSGNFLMFMTNHKSGKKKYNLEKIQQKLIIHIEYMKQDLLQFCDSLEERDDQGNFLPGICQTVSAVYLLSYYNSPKNCQDELVNEMMIQLGFLDRLTALRSKYNNIQLIGLPWFFFKDVLLSIKIKNLSPS